MAKLVSCTVKIEETKKNLVRDFCEKKGIEIWAFLGNAIQHEIERETRKEDLMMHEEYVKYGKKTATDFDEFAKKLGCKSKQR